MPNPALGILENFQDFVAAGKTGYGAGGTGTQGRPASASRSDCYTHITTLPTLISQHIGGNSMHACTLQEHRGHLAAKPNVSTCIVVLCMLIGATSMLSA